ncbi:TetR/AcrR family transcriptional regulator [Pseudokordiimonas caeni]|uniref:TetR/AcrR family transcriptional regulator n=1 Tax=Pseudokordiimonas caeni TaxID=2997908 RepID=UPI0028114525|nr:TetR/AcrR family transcriptional regulator [Pseudokordiimonas caeni]
MKEKRAYRLKDRAKSQEETRQKIVEATMHLHETLGPRATTISAIAEKAGVQRLTVYRHFPDETAVFQACTSHWLSLNPPPDPAAWEGIHDPFQRLQAALDAFFGYYAGTKAMWTASHRDVADVPALQGPMAEFAGFLGMVADGLAAAFDKQPNASLVTTLHHALAFPTWDDLDARGTGDAAKVALVILWVRGVLGQA